MAKVAKATYLCVSVAVAVALFLLAVTARPEVDGFGESGDVGVMVQDGKVDSGRHLSGAWVQQSRGSLSARGSEQPPALSVDSGSGRATRSRSDLSSDPSVTEGNHAQSRSIIGKNCPADGGVAPNCVRCMSSADCNGQGTCGVDEAGGVSCLVQNCVSDENCLPGFSCRQVGIPGQSGGVTQCRRGTAKEGDVCSLHGPPELTCGRALICGPDSQCVRSCDPGKNESQCQAGEQCAQHSWGGGYCHRSCKSDSDCGGGETCVHYGAFGNLCRLPVGAFPNCSASTTCPPGMACQIFLKARSVRFDCASCCSPLDAQSCGPGEVCGQSHSSDCLSVCYRSCVNAKDCGPGEACSTVSEDGTVWGCVLDVPDRR